MTWQVILKAVLYIAFKIKNSSLQNVNGRLVPPEGALTFQVMSLACPRLAIIQWTRIKIIARGDRLPLEEHPDSFFVSWFLHTNQLHDLDDYFESVAQHCFQNNKTHCPRTEEKGYRSSGGTNFPNRVSYSILKIEQAKPALPSSIDANS